MPHTPEEKRKAIARIRRIVGQAGALERAIEEGTSCASVLQQVAAIRGAVNGLMSEVLEGHLRESFVSGSAASPDDVEASISDVVKLVQTYLK